MSQQKQFEGPDIRALLDEIRATYGQDPTIARAESFRTGGLLGFFQRERYRLVVDGEPAQQMVAGAAEPEVEGPVQRPPGRHYARPAASTPAVSTPAVSSPDVSRALRAAYGALEETSDTLVADPTLEVGLVPGDWAADPLSSLIDQTEDSVTLGSTGPALPALADHPEPEPGDGLGDGPARPPDDGSFEAILRRVASLVDGPEAVPMVWPSLAELEPEPGPEPDPDPLPAAAVAAPEPAIDPPVAAEPPGLDGPVGDRAPADDTAPAAPVDTDLGLALHRVGFDPRIAAQILAAMADRDLEVAVLDFFDSLPPVPRPPDRNGSLIVVVGPPGRAGSEASRLAGDIGADPGAVVAARPGPGPGSSWDRAAIHCVEDAQEIAPGLRRGRVGVVAVEAGPGPADTVWAHNVIHALRPTFVVGVIDAMHKTEDIEAWVDGLGGLDAVIADHPESTVSPARLLDLEVPVARLGSSPATAARWAATVLDRVSPDGDAGGWGRP